MKTKKIMTNLIVNKRDTRPDKDLIYLKPLPKALKMILPWYFDNGINILDVTAGQQKIWSKTILSNEDLSGQPAYRVTFLDGDSRAKTDILGDFRCLPIKSQSQDLIIFDPPFIPVENAGERFAYQPKEVNGKTYRHKAREGRLFYFNNAFGEWVPPEVLFQQTWKEFNRVSKNGLIVKISERYEKGYEVPVLSYLDLCFDQRFNPLSEFRRVCSIGYRGNRFKLMGARMIHPQRVLTYYVVYKKNYKIRA
ncbi:MAG: hypothetical protein ACE5HI_20715 [bacterium]